MMQKSADSIIEENKDKIGAAEMERLFTMISDFKYVSLYSQSCFLDAGCGRGVLSFYLLFMNPEMKAKLIDVNEKFTVGLKTFFPNDYSEENYSFEKKNLFQEINALPGEEGYDLILCVDILEHIVFYDKIIQKLWAKVSPGGYLYIQTPSNYPSPSYPTVKVFLNNLRQRLHGLFPKIVSFGGAYHVRHGFSCKALRDKLDMLDKSEIVLAKEEYIRNPHFPLCGYKPRTSIIVRKTK